MTLRKKKQTPEHIAKRVQKNNGKKRTPEQIQRIRQGMKKYWDSLPYLDENGNPLDPQPEPQSEKET